MAAIPKVKVTFDADLDGLKRGTNQAAQPARNAVAPGRRHRIPRETNQAQTANPGCLAPICWLFEGTNRPSPACPR